MSGIIEWIEALAPKDKSGKKLELQDLISNSWWKGQNIIVYKD